MQVVHSTDLWKDAQRAAKEYADMQDWEEFLNEGCDPASGSASSSGIPNTSASDTVLPLISDALFEPDEADVREMPEEGEAREGHRHKRRRRKSHGKGEEKTEEEAPQTGGGKALTEGCKQQCWETFMSLSECEKHKLKKRLATIVCRIKSDFKEEKSIKLVGTKLNWVPEKHKDHKKLIDRFHALVYDDLCVTHAHDAHLVGAIADTQAKKDPARQNAMGYYGSVSLFTYNGPWGIMDISLKGEPKVPEVLQQLQVHPAFLLLEKSFEEFVTKLIDRKIIGEYAYSLELCEKTFIETQVVRVHIHFWFRMNFKSNWTEDSVHFKDTKPHRTKEFETMLGITNRNREMHKYAGCFYCQVPKTSTIMQKANINMFERFAVSDTWITRLYQRNKITASVAEDMYLKCVSKYEQNIKLLRMVERAKKAKRLEELQSLHYQELQQVSKPYRLVREVMLWLQCFEKCDFRYSFLVLGGESKMGKTRYVYSLFPRDKIFFVDCTTGLPDLQDFDYEVHDVILLDEIRVETMISIKKVLQAGPDVCGLGASSTNMYRYAVYVYRKKIILCTNDWTEESLNRLSHGDRKWLMDNACVVTVTHHLCQPDPINRFHDNSCTA